MGNPFKAMIMGYFLPLLAAGIVAFVPDYDEQFIKWAAVIFVILLAMPIVLSFRFPSNKEKAYRLTLTYQLYAFTFLFTFPLLKVLKENIVFQLLLVIVFISIYFLARYDQRTEVPIVYPDGDKEKKWVAYVYYAIPFLLIILGFGGNYIITRTAFQLFGNEFMMPYVSTILYLLSCWLLFLLSSVAYKSHVKEGYLEK
ncbi:hypothetical protein MHZ92_08825 [Sporosarcina sp. ACRSL]|uniref:hypothetical protein n=1 Tax=Sporosarcina sp. ACRSL TaxID=2918215 RepID=UPI001EF72565|nr:hypothetical protein [Sporosarcina sp. ACRSL]MCG7344235.1 hypothetical protein [Sporosarcina sp. ACRSL]